MASFLRGLGGALLLIAMVGCDAGIEKHITAGRKAAKAQDFKAAQAAFDEALKMDATNFAALWGKADAFRREGALPQQAEQLEKLLKIEAHKKRHHIMREALEQNLRKQADGVAGSDAAKAEALYRRCIDLNKKSEANVLLGKMLMSQGDTHLSKARFK